MNFDTIPDFLCGTGAALIIYSKTYADWLRDKAQERYITAQGQIAVVQAKLNNLKKNLEILGGIESESDTTGAFPSVKEKLEFKLELTKTLSERHLDTMLATAEMSTAGVALDLYTKELRGRAKESRISWYLGVLLFALGGIILIKGNAG